MLEFFARQKHEVLDRSAAQPASQSSGNLMQASAPNSAKKAIAPERCANLPDCFARQKRALAPTMVGFPFEILDCFGRAFS